MAAPPVTQPATHLVTHLQLPRDAPAPRALAAALQSADWQRATVYASATRETRVRQDVRDCDQYSGKLGAMLEPHQVPEFAAMFPEDERFVGRAYEFEGWQLLRYTERHHFARHTDGSAGAWHVGTVLLWPPRTCEGGELCIWQDTVTPGAPVAEIAPHDTMWTAVALRCDAVHSVNAVRAGVRVAFKARIVVPARALAPRLLAAAPQAQLPSAEDAEKRISELRAQLNSLRAQMRAARADLFAAQDRLELVVLARAYDWVPHPGRAMMSARDAIGLLDADDALVVHRYADEHAVIGYVPIDFTRCEENYDSPAARLHLDDEYDGNEYEATVVVPNGFDAAREQTVSEYNDESYIQHQYALCACLVLGNTECYYGVDTTLLQLVESARRAGLPAL